MVFGSFWKVESLSDSIAESELRNAIPIAEFAADLAEHITNYKNQPRVTSIQRTKRNNLLPATHYIRSKYISSGRNVRLILPGLVNDVESVLGKTRLKFEVPSGGRLFIKPADAEFSNNWRPVLSRLKVGDRITVVGKLLSLDVHNGEFDGKSWPYSKCHLLNCGIAKSISRYQIDALTAQRLNIIASEIATAD